MIFRNSNQCHLGKVLIKLAMYNFWRFTIVKWTMLVSAHSLIGCDLLSLNPILFICNFPVLFFSYDNDKEFYK